MWAQPGSSALGQPQLLSVRLSCMSGMTGSAPPCGLLSYGRLAWTCSPREGEEKPREQAESSKHKYKRSLGPRLRTDIISLS